MNTSTIIFSFLNICVRIHTEVNIMGINEIIQIGDRIKEFRKISGLTQKEMASLANIPYSTYSNYENNNREPNKEQLDKILHILDIPLSALIGTSPLDRLYRTLMSERHDLQKSNSYEPTEKKKSLEKYDEAIAEVKERYKGHFKDNSIIDPLLESISREYVLSTSDKKLEKMVEIFSKLNSFGKDKAIEHVEMLAKIPEYRKEED